MPETSSYYHVAYTVALSIYSLYALSLYIRRKRLKVKEGARICLRRR